MAYKLSIPTSTGTPTGIYYRLNVTNITQANPGVVTTSTNHGLTNKTKITFSDITSMTELNGGTYYVGSASSNTFQLYSDVDLTTSLDTLSYTAWVANTPGYLFPGDNADFVVDRGLTRSSKQRTMTAKFGDGYEQRLLDGINVKKEEFNASFKNRNKIEIDNLATFFDHKVPKSFDFTIDTETVKVVCDDYNINFVQTNIASLTCKLKRVYE